ncbi:copper resistance protein CopC [Microbacterium sp.]|uniref:copper resistance CopC family protein n=1 Tax=Microbacterium sp. TaxID=51671 RepID=UPI0025F01995|nr:copper resistance protein CopC [Microbacterium sp.]MBT9605037.1 copper resistance protein CopC [Microbacterium sp.]
MNTRFATRSPRWFIAAGSAVTAAFLLLTLSSPPPARAHDALIESSPTAESVVTSMPAEVSMTYSGEVFDASSSIAIEVIDSSGANVAVEAPVVADTTVTQAVEPVAAPGVVTVRWRVVSSDGHPISGEYAFTLDAPAASSPPANPAPSATPTESSAPTTSPTTPARSQANTPADTGGTEVEETSTGTGTPLLVIGAIVVIAGVLALVFSLIGRRRRQQVKQQTDATDEQ